MLLVRAQIALSVEVSFSCRLFMNVHGQRASLLVIHELFYCRVVFLCISFSFCLLIEGGMEGLYLSSLFCFVCYFVFSPDPPKGGGGGLGKEEIK